LRICYTAYFSVSVDLRLRCHCFATLVFLIIPRLCKASTIDTIERNARTIAILPHITRTVSLFQIRSYASISNGQQQIQLILSNRLPRLLTRLWKPFKFASSRHIKLHLTSVSAKRNIRNTPTNWMLSRRGFLVKQSTS